MVAEDKHTRWKRITLQQWYGEKKRMIEIISQTAVWYHTGQPPLPIRWVLVRDPKQIFKTQALLCTDPSVSAAQIVHWFVQRWQVEVTLHEVRTHLGVETQRQWADLSILRTFSDTLALVEETLFASLIWIKSSLGCICFVGPGSDCRWIESFNDQPYRKNHFLHSYRKNQ